MSAQRRLKFGGAMLMALSVTIFVCVIVACAAAHGQPTSAPVCVCPPVSGGVLAWLKTNAAWFVPLVLEVLATLATGLSEFPRAGRVVKGLRLAIAVLSVVPFKNSPGSLKAPFVPATPPRG